MSAPSPRRPISDARLVVATLSGEGSVVVVLHSQESVGVALIATSLAADGNVSRGEAVRSLVIRPARVLSLDGEARVGVPVVRILSEASTRPPEEVLTVSPHVVRGVPRAT